MGKTYRKDAKNDNWRRAKQQKNNSGKKHHPKFKSNGFDGNVSSGVDDFDPQVR